MKTKILVATDIDDIAGLMERFYLIFDVTYLPDLSQEDMHSLPDDIELIFTNPNNSQVYFGEKVLSKFLKLKCLATASTGTIHIDKDYCAKRGINVISITTSYKVLQRISSTAEMAFLLTMSAVRNYDQSRRAVDNMKWDYSQFIGRQINCLTIGVLGFGRLGKMYAQYCRAFGAEVLCCDPFKIEDIVSAGYQACDINHLFEICDVVSLHVHADVHNLALVSASLIEDISRPFILVNTSRGEVVDEAALLRAIEKNHQFKYATDVIENEHFGLENSRLRYSNRYGSQIFITPHCGGMTSDARSIAYNHAADLLFQQIGIDR